MSDPRTINAYLAALNAALEVGLRSRPRILAEVEDHLRQATDEQLRHGLSLREAQRRAVAAFGPAEQVAARFDAGLVGALDRCLALSVRRMHYWMTQRRWGVPAFAVVVSMLLGAAVGAFGALFGRDPILAASACLAGGAGVVMICVTPAFKRVLQDTAKNAATALVPLYFTYPATGSCVVLLSGGSTFDDVEWFAGAALVQVGLFGTQAVIERAVKRAALRYVGATGKDPQQAWSTDHPWRAAAAGVAPLPLLLVMLIAVFPAPASATFRVGLVAVVGLLAVLAAGAVRLESARRERDVFQRVFTSG